MTSKVPQNDQHGPGQAESQSIAMASNWIAAIVVMAAGGCLGRLRSGGQSDQNSGGKLIRGIQSGPSLRWIAKPPCDIVGTLLTDLRSEV